jgi:heme/copper-type cytochrome/quinol oxidase subunit 2
VKYSVADEVVYYRGMQLSGQRLVLILAYVALALGLVVVLVPVYFCIWRCSKRRNEKEDGEHELTIYDHNYR